MRFNGRRARLPIRLTIIAVLASGLAAMPAYGLGGRESVVTMLVAAGLSLVTIVASYLILVFAFRNVKQIQMIIVLGGFVLRMAILFGLVAWIARAFVVDLNQLVLWLVTFYMVLVIAEGYELAAQARRDQAAGA